MAIDPERQEWNKRALEASSFDAVVCLAPTNVLLLSGYWPVMGNSIAVFTRQGECAVLLPEDEMELAQASSSAGLEPYRPGSLETITTALEQFTSPLLKLLNRLGLGSAKIGLALDQSEQPASYAAMSRYTGQLQSCLQSGLSDATYVTCDTMLAALAARRTRVELEILRKGCAVAAHGFRAVEGAVQAGVSEHEFVGIAQSAFESAPQPAMQRSYGFFWCMSGPNSAKASAAFAQTRARTAEHGDLLMLHANTCADGYWTDITRTWSVGEPTNQHKGMRDAIAEASAAALREIRPGVRAAEVDRAAREVMKAHGFGAAFRHSTGHGVGLAAANGNAQPRIHPASPDVLEEGMTFNVEPAAYFDGYGGMRHCDVVAVTTNGVEVLTEF